MGKYKFEEMGNNALTVYIDAIANTRDTLQEHARTAFANTVLQAVKHGNSTLFCRLIEAIRGKRGKWKKATNANSILRFTGFLIAVDQLTNGIFDMENRTEDATGALVIPMAEGWKERAQDVDLNAIYECLFWELEEETTTTPELGLTDLLKKIGPALGALKKLSEGKVHMKPDDAFDMEKAAQLLAALQADLGTTKVDNNVIDGDFTIVEEEEDPTTNSTNILALPAVG